MTKKYIGLDIGTTSIKISVVDSQLVSLCEKQYEYDYLTPHKNWTEINPDTWLDIVLKGLNEVFQQIPEKNVSGIGITGQMHTTVFVDKNGCSIRPSIMWNDNRTKDMIPSIKEKLLESEQTAYLAKVVSTGSPLANLLWLKEYEPENYKRTEKILMAKDYLIWKLTEVYSTDYCDASVTSFYDFSSDSWSKSVQKLFNLKPSLFPEINVSSKVVGFLSKKSQQQLAIQKEIPVVAGTGDNVASALASGSFVHDQPLISLGTSGVVVIPNRFHQLKATGKNVVAKINEDDQMIITQGTVQSGAKVNSWWLENIIHRKNYLREQEKISDQLIGNNDVLFFPHLNGEKTLYGEPNLRGAFVGLSLQSTQEEMYLAVLEGLTFGIKSLYEKMKNEEEPDYFTVVGGGAKSELWLQLFADILNYPIRRVRNNREAVQGAAILAILSVENRFDFPESDFQTFEPRQDKKLKYEKKYINYTALAQTVLTYTEVVKEE